MIALEAISFGTPVIASRMGGMPEIIEKIGDELLYDADNDIGNIVVNYDKSKYSSLELTSIYEKYYSPQAYMTAYLRLMDR